MSINIYGTNYGRIIYNDDADSFEVEINKQKINVQVLGVDAPEPPKPLDHRDFENYSLLRKLKVSLGQPEGQRSTEIGRKIISENGGFDNVRIDLSGVDSFNTYGAQIFLKGKDGWISYNSELVKNNAAYIIFESYFRDFVPDESVIEHFNEQLRNHSAGKGKGIYSSDARVPSFFRRGEDENLDFYKQSPSYSEYIRKKRFEESSIKNSKILSVFDRERNRSGFLISSRYTGSYFYNIALYNATQRKLGKEVHSFTSDGMATKAYFLSKASNNEDTTISGITKFILKTFDSSVQRPGLGNWLNEHVFLPAGMGRIYKEELGALGSLAGLVGRVLDQTVNFFSTNEFYRLHPELTLAPLDLQTTALEQERRTGFFETALPAVVGFGLTTIASLGTYFALEVPLGYFTADLTRESINYLLKEGFTPPASNSKFTSGIKSFFRASAIDAFHVFSSITDIQKEIEGLYGDVIDYSTTGTKTMNLPDYLMKGVSLSSFTNNFYRKTGAYLTETVILNFVNTFLNPYRPGSPAHKHFLNTQRELVEAIAKPIELQMEYTILDPKNPDPDKPKVFKLNKLEIDPNTLGYDRNVAIVRKMQDIMDLIPLNPLNWGIGSLNKGLGYIDDTKNIYTLGDVLNFEDLTLQFHNIFLDNRIIRRVNIRNRLLPATPFNILKQALYKPINYLLSVKDIIQADLARHQEINKIDGFGVRDRNIRNLKLNFKAAGLFNDNPLVSPSGNTSTKINVEKTINLTKDTSGDLIDNVIEFIVESEVQSYKVRETYKKYNPSIPGEVSYGNMKYYASSNQIKERNILKTARLRKQGKLTELVIDNLTFKRGIYSVAVGYLLIDSIFNPSKGAGLLEQVAVDYVLWGEGSPDYQANGLISGNVYWQLTATTATIATSIYVGTSRTHYTESVTTVKNLPVEKRNLLKDRIRTAIDANLLPKVDGNVYSIISKSGNDYDIKLNQDIAVKTPRKYGDVYSNILGTYIALRGGFFVLNQLGSGLGRIKNAIVGRADKLNYDVVTVGEIAQFKEALLKSLDKEGEASSSTTLRLAGIFSADSLIQTLNIVEDEKPIAKKTSMFVLQATSQMFQFFLGFSTETIFRNEEVKKVIGLKFGFQGPPVTGINYLFEAPISFIPTGLKGKGILNGDTYFVQRQEGMGLLQWSQALGDFTFQSLVALSFIYGVSATVGLTSDFAKSINNKNTGIINETLDAISISSRNVQNMVMSLTKAGTQGLSWLDTTADNFSNAVISFTKLPYKTYEGLRNSVLARNNLKNNNTKLRGKFLRGIVLGYLLFSAVDKGQNLLSDTLFGEESPGALNIAKYILPTTAATAGISYSFLKDNNAIVNTLKTKSTIFNNSFNKLAKIANTIDSTAITRNIKIRKSTAFIVATSVIYNWFKTDSNFGFAVDMDTDTTQRIMSVGLAGGLTGTAFALGRNLAVEPGDILNAYLKTQSLEEVTNNATSFNLKKIKQEMLKVAKPFTNVVAEAYKSYINYKTTRYAANYIEFLDSLNTPNGVLISKELDKYKIKELQAGDTKFKYTEEDGVIKFTDETIDFIKESRKKAQIIVNKRADQLVDFIRNERQAINTVASGNKKNINLLRDAFEDKAFSNYLSHKGLKGKGLILGFVGVAALTTITTAVVNIYGGITKKGYIDGSNKDNFFGALDGTPLEFLADTVRLITGTDRSVSPSIYEGGLQGEQIAQSVKLLKNTDNDTNTLLRATEALMTPLLINASNVFITTGSVGISIRSAEEGPKVTTYAQFQTAGFDISTATYELVKKYNIGYGYKNAKTNMIIQRELKKISNGVQLNNDTLLDYGAVTLTRVSAYVDPLVGKEKRKVSKILETYQTANVTSSPIVSIILKSRIRDTKQFVNQPLESIIARSTSVTDISIYNVLSEKVVSDLALSNGVESFLTDENSKRLVFIRLGYHLKNAFNKEARLTALFFSNKQLKATGPLTEEAISSFELQVAEKNEVQNGFLKVVSSLFTDWFSLVNNLTKFAGLGSPATFLIMSFTTLGLLSVGYATLSKLTSFKGAREFRMLDNMFNIKGANETERIFSFSRLLTENSNRNGVIYIENQANIFSNQLSNPLLSIELTEAYSSIGIEKKIQLGINIEKSLNSVFRIVDDSNHTLLRSIYNFGDEAKIGEFFISDPELLNNLNKRFNIINQTTVFLELDVFKTNVVQVLDQYYDSIFEAIEKAEVLIGESKVTLTEVIKIEELNTIRTALRDNAETIIETFFTQKLTNQIEIDKQKIAKVNLGKNQKDTILDLLSILFDDYLDDELLAIQRYLYVLNPADEGIIKNLTRALRTIARENGGILNVKNNPFMKSIFTGRSVTIRDLNLPEDIKLRRTQEPFQKRFRKGLNKTWKVAGGVFNTINIGADVIDTFGFLSRYGYASYDGSFTEAELDYLALEAANAQVGAILFANMISLTFKGYYIPQLLKLSTKAPVIGGAAKGIAGVVSNISKTLQGVPAPIKVGAILLGVIGISVAATRKNKYNESFLDKSLNALENTFRTISKTVSPTIAKAQKSIINLIDNPTWKDFATGGLSGFAFGLTLATFLAGTIAAAVTAPVWGTALAIIGISTLVFATINVTPLGKFISDRLFDFNRWASKVPILNFFFTSEGSSLYLLDDHTSGPIFFASSRQAVEATIEKYYSLEDDVGNTITMNYLFGPSLNNQRNTSSSQVPGLEKGPIQTNNSNIVNAILMSRSKYFRQQIVGTSIYLRVIENYKNQNKLKEQLIKDALDKETAIKLNKEAENLRETDQKNIASILTKPNKDFTDEAVIIALGASGNNDNEIPDTSKRTETSIIVSRTDFHNPVLEFNNESISRQASREMIVATKLGVSKENNKIKLNESISTNNDLLLSVIPEYVSFRATV